MAKIATLGELCDLYAVSEKTILSWAKLIGDTAKSGRGKYNLDAFQEFAKHRASLDKSHQDLQKEKTAAEVREINARADARLFDLSIKKGEYVPLDEAIADLNTALITARARFLAMPSKLALPLSGMGNPKEIAHLLQEEIDANLLAIAEALQDYAKKKTSPEGEAKL